MSIPYSPEIDRAALRPRSMYLLYIAGHAVRSEVEQLLRPLSLTGIQYSILTMIESNGGMSSAEVSRRFFVTPQTMNQTIQGLVNQGLLEKSRDENNKRVLILTLTPAGLELLAQADVIADKVEREAFAVLDDAELAMMRKLLSRVFEGRIQGR